ncbi:MAG TPA: hypothetical protein VGS78_10205 [Candidatus Sulfotelmatobacter sp.]|nr:hypothetical protein [Candidatus Sulfotelmatobacter sp.]
MGTSRYYLEKKAKSGFRGYPVATLALYGPNDQFASKVVVAIFHSQSEKADVVEGFSSKVSDVRFDEDIGNQVLALIESHAIKSLAMRDRIIGCPHEEGIDYPEGATCPECPFWAGRDRWTGERIH